MTEMYSDKSATKPIEQVLSGKIQKFSEIVECLKLSPKTCFRFVDLSGVDFGDADLAGYDFTGSDLRGADLTNSRILGAILPDGETIESLNPMQSYRVFSNEFDETIDILSLCEYEDAKRMDLLLKNQASYEYINSISPDGIDASQLAITFLADCSGSMRGEKIVHTMITLQILAKKLETIGASVEVLGFTTRAWKGGRTREKWVKAGKPSNPGRLNDLRHLIIKPFEQSFASRELAFSVPAREGILKENIDGEAIFWAFRRLVEQVHEERCLFVVSDGASVDDSTLSTNPESFLTDNLKSVVRWIEKDQLVKIGAVGIGFDVTRYYSVSRGASNVATLPSAIIEALNELIPSLSMTFKNNESVNIEPYLKDIDFTGSKRSKKKPSNLREYCRHAELPFPEDYKFFMESWGREARHSLSVVQKDFPELSLETQLDKLSSIRRYNKEAKRFKALLTVANMAQLDGYINLDADDFRPSNNLYVKLLGVRYILAPAFKDELKK